MASRSPVHFTPKNQYALKNNILSGICLGPWLKILSERYHCIEWRTYWLRVLFITVMACFNTLFALWEQLLYGRQIAQAKVNPRPVFILGHPRTGTTLLHNLLSRDDEQFGFSNTFQVGFPSAFLLLERFKSWLTPVIDKTRPMDNMELTFDLPQEDELAVNMLSGGVSPYMPLVFMRQEPSFRPFFSFEKAAPAKLQCWTEAFLFFLRKLTVKYGPQRRLLLKSPVHTSRVKLLLQLFPDAEFIYIHRDPYVVFQSAVHMADTTYWFTYLNTPSDEQVLDFVVNQYDTLYKDYIEARGLVPKGRLLEVSFATLERDPIAQVRAIYAHFGWPWTPGLEQKMQRYCHTLMGFKKNDHVALSEESRALVARRWRASFDMFGYPV